MNTQESYLFWRLAHYFIAVQQYRIIQLSKDQNELWLEKMENKRARVIRLLCHNLDWSNWLQRDIELTSANGESIRRQLRKGELNVLNLYFSEYPPVDDYQFRMEKPFINPQSNKTQVESILFTRENQISSLEKLSQLFQDRLSFSIPEDISEDEIEKVKSAALTIAVNKIKTEKSMFEFGKPLFTYVFLAIQIIIYLLMEISGGSTNTNTLIKFGAKFNPLILDGEWWRFFTPIFIHIGLLHLFMNSLALYYLGITVEKIFGRIRFIFIYLFAGFCGSLASFLFSPNLSAGASGAIFGCFGALLFFGLMYPKLFMRTMGLNIFIVIAINLAFGFSMEGIDNAGHVGGLIGGFLATGILQFPKKKKWLQQGAFFILSAVLSISMLYYGFHHRTKLLDEQSTLYLAHDYIQSNEWKKAKGLLDEYIGEHTDSADSYFLLSYTEIKMNQVNLAKEHLLQTIELEPNMDEAHYNLALIYANLHELDQAKKYANKAAEIDPDKKEYQDLVQKLNQ
ncbi:rhomboid family intramembrane serine protease [Cytobacillus sp. Hz8]|uniref:rhomboid family intramembrane serine protease n=1 Tax=Cytobacillus sp. Hz8 TaxID=3347168 RepID=UPI0035E38BB1